MATAATRGGFEPPAARFDRRPRAAALAFTLAVALGPGGAAAGDGGSGPRAGDGRYCSATARSLHRACQHEVQDDHWAETAICLNLADAAERAECVAARDEARHEGRELCREQLEARREACALLGEDRYDPDFDPASFEDDFGALAHSNPHLPLAIGNAWEYRGGDEVVTVEVLDETKLIEGVRCIVVRDRVTIGGEVVEDTDDWLAQAMNGDVWYCGEEAKDFESFDGDAPRRPELVSIEGSFKAGRDGAKPGILLPASPQVGDVYREEFSLGDAEDLAEVLSVTYAYGLDPELDLFVPSALADLLCSGDCMVTRNFTPLEPGAVARKYYAPGIGPFLEVVPESGEIVQLTSCNVDPRCAMLPPP